MTYLPSIGKEPFSWFALKDKAFKDSMSPMETGMLPVKQLEPAFNTSSSVKLVKSAKDK